MSEIFRLSVVIYGAVQGVGFRPFVYRLASELRLTGWINNSAQGVFIEVEGSKNTLDQFLIRLQSEKPPRASIQSLEHSFLDPVGYETFEIRESDSSGTKSALVLPDIATCPDCVNDLFDPSNRRYLYPFTNCTNCGPRFSIVEALPYDRPNTSMKNFIMCPECFHEYQNPLDRRFHAQPNACPECGPKLELWDATGKTLADRHSALQQTAQAIREGKIVAVKGIGGFHVMVDARNDEAVKELRRRKHREEKPLALMVPNVAYAKILCEVSILEEQLLISPEAPIVLLRKLRSAETIPPLVVSSSVAPRNPYLGLMLPYAPLHLILMRELGIPVVATSGNLSDEPICIDEDEAVSRLHGIADLFLVHNRPIVRHVDDSIVRIMMGRELVLRRARGYAPLPIQIQSSNNSSVLAVGAHLKNNVGLLVGNNAFISQHIGDLETRESLDAFHHVISDFQKLYESQHLRVACDLHPEYLSSQHARTLSLDLIGVQHHYAHILSCMAENRIEGEVLGVAWDGTGFGLDGSIWGGEFLTLSHTGFDRFATFRPFRLPGGEKAIHEPRRIALGVLHEIWKDSLYSKSELPLWKSFSPSEIGILKRMLQQQTNSPVTTSVGRLFDAVAALLGIRSSVRYEGQAAMELEFLTDGVITDQIYPFSLSSNEHSELMYIDWQPMIEQIIAEIRNDERVDLISAKFHNTLVEIIIEVASRAGREQIVLSGGCFQNRYLTERTIERLRASGFRPYWHQRIPPNDGGISLGQIAAVLRSDQKR